MSHIVWDFHWAYVQEMFVNRVHSIQVGVAGIKRGTAFDLSRTRQIGTASRWPTRDGGLPLFGSDSWFRRSNRKVLVDHPLPACQVKRVSYGVKSRSARVGKVVHPCRVNLFEKPCLELRTTWERIL
jgi:hypothetical protein